MKHVHYDVIVAHAEGKKIQRWSTECGCWLDVDEPPFHAHMRFRVKPRSIRVRLFMGICGNVKAVTEEEFDLNHSGTKWLTQIFEREV